MTRAALLNRPERAQAEIRVRGIVQGVGFRPTVWRIANACGLSGRVLNDGAGVLIEVVGAESAIGQFMDRLVAEAPPLSRIDAIERRAREGLGTFDGFTIAKSAQGEMRTAITPDAASCGACRSETLSHAERRFRYPFTNCTHCGPRFSIVTAAPYDRATTTMTAFAMCAECAAEYADPADRRFHAQPIACPVCGPQVKLVALGSDPSYTDPVIYCNVAHEGSDPIKRAAALIGGGAIVAVKGLGGFHLACDATDPKAVSALRSRKRRSGKPFALMARDLDVIRRYCRMSAEEQRLLESPEAPIVLLDRAGERLPEAVALGFDTLGFMLPYTPLHVLLMESMAEPVVMTSGNLSDEPQVIDNSEAREKLGGIADFALLHNRDIANRVDDSVVRVMAGAPRFLRRARGYAPGAFALPAGFEGAPDLLAFGGELKATFCLVKDGSAILSQHQGDLEEVAALEDYEKNLGLYAALYDHRPALFAADAHPEYLSRKLARQWSEERGLSLIETQHHHAHIAACLAENGRTRDAAPVLGIALDGAGWGDDGTIWGGEFLLADYAGYERLATFKPVALIGGAQAIREPWRNTYAHLVAAIGWERFAKGWRVLDLFAFLDGKPRAMLDRMLATGVNAPLASSCGRLFDAVAAAVGLAAEHATFEGEGAMLLEAAVDHAALANEDEALAYPFAVSPKQSPRAQRHSREGGNPGHLADQVRLSDLESRLRGNDVERRQGGTLLTGEVLPRIDPAPLWPALLDDLARRTPIPTIAARFHRGLARAIAAMAEALTTVRGERDEAIDTVALSGGCFHNRVLLEETERRLRVAGFTVLMHTKVPAGDGGLALGQAAIAAARAIAKSGQS